VGLNSDSSVKGLKGESRPVQCEEDRAIILSSLGSVQYVVLFSEDTPENLIKAVKPDVLVKGGDWAIDKIVGADFVQSRGGEVRSLPFVDGRSSSNLIDKLKSL
jgi:D-beta-D-heptose 7-phosphate kinase/D-beta-D-heptose 1-phosphate adenosyltransferase